MRTILRRPAVLPPLLVFVAVLAGCESEPIQTYKVPKSEPAPEPVATVRMLGAIFPAGEQSWFFKLSGPIDAVGKLEKPFEALVTSVKLVEGKPSWTNPEGWRQLPGEGLRFATVKTGPDDAALEVTVGSAGGSLRGNVDRWRGQIGLKPARGREMEATTRAIDADGIKGTFVDLRGPGGAGGMPGMPPPGGGGKPPPPPPSGKPPFNYTVPEGWKETQPFAGIEVLAWKAGDAKFAVSSASGELLANVNRWRMQVGLGAWTADELKKEQKSINVSGRPAPYFDLDGGKLRILGVILTQGERTWFFKMTGPAGTVANQQAAFEAFLRSVHFE